MFKAHQSMTGGCRPESWASTGTIINTLAGISYRLTMLTIANHRLQNMLRFDDRFFLQGNFGMESIVFFCRVCILIIAHI